MKISFHILITLFLALITAANEVIAEPAESVAESAEHNTIPTTERHIQPSRHTNNWAVLVSTSRFWFNYRHMANVLSLYRTVKRLGIPDSQIILMLADDIACNPRNAFPGFVFNNANRQLELYGDNVEVDYRGYEVTVENFIRLLTDRWPEDQPRSKRLMTDEHSNIFIYMTGHGGDNFLKFQDAEEIGSHDIADAFEQMAEKKRYNEILFMIDTCQANTMYSEFYSPNIISVGSSALDESSYSHHSDVEIGVAVIDRFTYYTLEFLEEIEKDSNATLQDLFDSYTFEKVHSNAGFSTELFGRNVSEVLITDFFGNVQNVIVDKVEDDLLYIANHDEEGEILTTEPIEQRENVTLERKPISEYSRTKIVSNKFKPINFIDSQKVNSTSDNMSNETLTALCAFGGLVLFAAKYWTF